MLAVFNVGAWPGWFYFLRLFFACLITAGFGIHAHYRHRQEANEIVSPRKWMYWIYSMVFLAACAANFTQLCTTMVFQNYTQASFHLGYFTALLLLSYFALLAGNIRMRIE